MTETMKILGQSSPAATTNTTIYTVPSQTQAVISSIIIANTTAGALTYRIHVLASGGTTAQTNAIYYDVSLAANTSLVVKPGITLSEDDFIVIYASAVNMVFTVFGVEIS